MALIQKDFDEAKIGDELVDCRNKAWKIIGFYDYFDSSRRLICISQTGEPTALVCRTSSIGNLVQNLILNSHEDLSSDKAYLRVGDGDEKGCPRGNHRLRRYGDHRWRDRSGQGQPSV